MGLVFSVEYISRHNEEITHLKIFAVVLPTFFKVQSKRLDLLGVLTEVRTREAMNEQLF